ncbi:MAG: hypothetical protein Q4D89_04925 [Arachnia propionica]|uniref:hypothetical protein n=1 Tax=Arachnia propionica TaxID=1750 RepID=UPI00270B4B71|nr:hypothetical protein [Arachnia propionica]
MTATSSYHRIKGGRFIVAASPKLLDGELKQTSILRSVSAITAVYLVGGLVALMLAVGVLWLDPAMHLSCARAAANEPINCVLTTTGLSGNRQSLIEDVRSASRTPEKGHESPGDWCHLSTGPDLAQAYRWDDCVMDVAILNLMIADPDSLETVTHEQRFRSSWLFAAGCLIIAAGCAWLALRHREDLRWEIDPTQGRVKVFRGGLGGVDSTIVAATNLSALQLHTRGDDWVLAIPGLPLALPMAKVDGQQLIAAYDEFRRSLRGDG